MQQEFTVKNGLKIFYYLLGAVLIGFGLFILTLPNRYHLTYFVPVYFSAIGIIIVINAVWRKVTIANGTITVAGPFKTREIAVSDVKGIRFGQKRITIVSKNPGQSDVAIVNYANLNSDNQLVNYLKGTFTDLDAVDLDEQQQSLLQDFNLGFTAEERQVKLDNAKKVALLYNILGIVVAVLFLISKEPVFAIIALIYPLLSVIVMASSKGLIKFFSQQKKSIYPLVFFGFIAPAMALGIKTLASYHIYSFNNLMLPFLGTGCAVMALLFITGINRSAQSDMASQILLMLFASLFYAFGSIGQINCGYDKSPDQIYKAAVIGHHVSHGRSTSYYLYLSTWGPCHEQKEVSVGYNFYNQTNVGDSVKIDLKPGLLHIPWFVVYRN